MHNPRIVHSIVFFIIFILVFSLYNELAITIPGNEHDSILCYGRPVLEPNLKPGDIVWRWSYIPMITHCLIYIGETEDHRYQFIEANSLEDVWMPTYNHSWLQSELFPTICRVKTNQTTVQHALDFAKAQVGKKFAYIHEKEFDPNAEFWYCTEIVWAAFYSTGIDIDVNGWHKNVIFDAPVIMPFEIYLDDDIRLLKMAYS